MVLHVIHALVQDDLLSLAKLGFFTELIILRFGAEKVSLCFQSHWLLFAPLAPDFNIMEHECEKSCYEFCSVSEY